MDVRTAFLVGTWAVTSSGAAFAQATVPGTGRPGQADSVGLEEIVVTAQKRAENLQDVPIAISAISADALSAAGAQLAPLHPISIMALNFVPMSANSRSWWRARSRPVRRPIFAIR